jgi:hypothetical protein
MALKGMKAWKAWIVGITSVVVVVPALINAANDVYVTVAKLPRNEAERVNQALYMRYFNKQPVIAVPLPIKHSLGTVDATISVYEGGDVLVEYGDRQQWFPFPAPKKEIGFLVSHAYAGDVGANARGIGSYRQTDRVDGRVLVRKRDFANGITEEQRIDTRTGEVLERSTKPSQKASLDVVAPIGVIDLESKAKAPGPKQPEAARCVVANGGDCTLVRPLVKGAECYCAAANGVLAGRAQ